MRKTDKRLFSRAEQYHRNHPWKLNEEGVYARHDYSERSEDSLSWWDDFGFIFAKRRIMVWWRHPRHEYQDRLSEQAELLCEGTYPGEEKHWFEKGTPIIRRVGSGMRKKISGYRMAPLSPAYTTYLEKLRATEKELAARDVGIVVQPSFKVEILPWCQGVNLLVPGEIRKESDIPKLRETVLRLLREGPRALEQFGPYTFADWRQDAQKSETFA